MSLSRFTCVKYPTINFHCIHCVCFFTILRRRLPTSSDDMNRGNVTATCATTPSTSTASDSMVSMPSTSTAADRIESPLPDMDDDSSEFWEDMDSSFIGNNRNKSLEIKTISEFNGDYVRLSVHSSPKYHHYMDVLKEMNPNGDIYEKVFNSPLILNHGMVQIHLSISMHKANDDGTDMEKTEFHVWSKPIRKLAGVDHIRELKKTVIKRITETSVSKSGWSYKNIEEIDFDFFKNNTTLGQKRKYKGKTEYPENLPGSRGVINIDCSDKDDCLLVSLVAGYLYRKDRKECRPWHIRSAQHYRNFNMKYEIIKFPKNIQSPIDLDDFTSIENKLDQGIFLYQISTGFIVNEESEDTTYSLSLVRRPSKMFENNVYLCTLDDSDHLMYIKDINQYLSNIRRGHYSAERLKKSPFCPICCNQVQSDKYNFHYKNCFSNKKNPRVFLPGSGTKYKFTAFSALEKAPFVAFYDIESILIPQCHEESNTSSRILQKHKAISYCYIIVDKDGKIASMRTKTGDDPDLIKNMMNNIFEDHTELMARERETWCLKPFLTDIDEKIFASSKACDYCDKVYEPKNPKVRHHNYNIHPKYSSDGTLETGNFIAPICSRCNIKITIKNYTLPTLAHNSSRYDIKFIASSIDDSFSSPFIVSQSGENFINLSVERAKSKNFKKIFSGDQEEFIPDSRISFQDSFKYLSTSLEKLVSSMPKNKKLDILEQGLEKSKIPKELGKSLSSQKGVFCYDYVSSPEKLLETKLPPRKAFFNNLKNEPCSPKNYQFAKNLFNQSKCKNLQQYMELYLISDVLLLAEVYSHMREKFIREYKLDPSRIITLPSYAVQAALLDSKVEIDLLDNLEIYHLFEESILGGLTTLIEKFAQFNNIHVGYDPTKPVTCGAYFDLNSLYATILNGLLPCFKIHELTPKEVENFNWRETSPSEKYFYAMTISGYVKPEAMDITDDLPLSITKQEISIDDLSESTKKLVEDCKYSFTAGKNLVASHEPLENYLISLERLQLLVKLGLEVTAVHRVFKFEQKAFLRDFIQKNINLRRNATNSFDKDLYKLINNSIYGKFMYNARKHDMEVKLVSNHQTFARLVKNPFLHSVTPIGKNKLLMKFKAKSVELKYPLFIGWSILELSKKKFLFHVL